MDFARVCHISHVFGHIAHAICLHPSTALLGKHGFYPQELDHLLSTLSYKTFIRARIKCDTMRVKCDEMRKMHTKCDKCM